MRPVGEKGGEEEKVRGERNRRVGEGSVLRRVPGVPLVSAGDEVHHHQSALGHRDIEVRRLADDRGIDVPRALHCDGHGRMASFFAVAEDHDEPSGGRASGLGDVHRRRHHRGDRPLRVPGAATVEASFLDRRSERVAGPPVARRNHVEVRNEREGGAWRPAGHLDAHTCIIAYDVEAPAARRRLREPADGLFAAADGRRRDELPQELDLSRPGQRQGRSPSPFARRSSCRSRHR